jgi:hypothetical protein
MENCNGGPLDGSGPFFGTGMSDIWDDEGRDIGLSAKRFPAVRLTAWTGY